VNAVCVLVGPLDGALVCPLAIVLLPLAGFSLRWLCGGREDREPTDEGPDRGLLPPSVPIEGISSKYRKINQHYAHCRYRILLP